MSHLVVVLLLAGGSIGLVAGLAQCIIAELFLRKPQPAPAHFPPISILKPLCGVDDDLERNLASFLQLDYPVFELLLGVRSEADPAWPLARTLEARWPGKVRAVLQRGAPGLNPKVNQLLTLASEAKHELILISDSNVRVRPNYLGTIGPHFQDPGVGLVTHPVVGVGGARIGARMDNLHLTSGMTLGVISAKHAVNQDIVIGKSIAVRRADVRAMGGFEALQDILAEDFVLGRWTSKRLGKRVVLSTQPVFNVAQNESVGGFLRRYERWSVMQRKTVGLGIYLLQLMLNPFFLTTLALALRPLPSMLAVAGACCIAKCLLDGWSSRRLAGEAFPLHNLWLVPLKDVLIGFAWIRGLIDDRIDWRSNKLRVLPGSRLLALEAGSARLPSTAWPTEEAELEAVDE